MPRTLTNPQAGDAAQKISAEIRGEMGRQRISGLKLSAAIGTSQNYLAKRLRDERSLNLNDVEAICEALKITPKDLISATKPAP